MEQVQETKVKKARPIRCTVVSDKMQKSRVGVVERLVKEPMVGKYVRRRSKLMFHDESNLSRVGDEVLVEVTRPMSHSKRHKLKEIVRRAE